MTTQTEYAEAWRPSPGDELAGTVARIDTRTNNYGQYPVITIATKDGETAVHAFHAVLGRELAGNVQVGTAVRIKYNGKQLGTNERGSYPFHNYTVSIGGEVPTAEVVQSEPTPAKPTIAERAAEKFGDDPPW